MCVSRKSVFQGCLTRSSYCLWREPLNHLERINQYKIEAAFEVDCISGGL